MNKEFKTKEDIFNYIENNPTFITGFTAGEGCFTGYAGFDLGAT
jgi:hypothetical protein